jgi:hypothetical protein
MTAKKNTGSDKLDAVVAAARRSQAEREQGYRDQALKLYPWVCGRCSREFTRSNLQELTVHHRDHNHDNNPPDGRNCCVCTAMITSMPATLTGKRRQALPTPVKASSR